MVGCEGPGAEELGISSIVASVDGVESRQGGTSAGVLMMYSSHHVQSSPKEMEKWIGTSCSGMSAKIQ
jgi:hypothetical protein